MYTLYKVNCETPKHIYIGISQKPFKRILDHKRKSGAVFTRKHGVRSFKLLAEFNTEREAKDVERNEVIKLGSLKKITGDVICGGGWTRRDGIKW